MMTKATDTATTTCGVTVTPSGRLGILPAVRSLISLIGHPVSVAHTMDRTLRACGRVRVDAAASSRTLEARWGPAPLRDDRPDTWRNPSRDGVLRVSGLSIDH